MHIGLAARHNAAETAKFLSSLLGGQVTVDQTKDNISDLLGRGYNGVLISIESFMKGDTIPIDFLEQLDQCLGRLEEDGIPTVVIAEANLGGAPIPTRNRTVVPRLGEDWYFSAKRELAKLINSQHGKACYVAFWEGDWN